MAVFWVALAAIIAMVAGAIASIMMMVKAAK
ncbi:hypothetical protein SAMN05444406_1734 [Caldicoprobacter faecalis]|uniref:Uncharacterized protein n=1 Tax=Caldicoprobacter faecalis TaxID=937334 RepID=A0A1I5YWS4_9FIRM|nr:hypothetical protein SAMN05444406_1734 [Caldicoprobacter faecalis]